MSAVWGMSSGATAMSPPPDLQAVCLYLTPPFDLSSKADPNSSYTTTGIAVWIIGVPKPPRHDTVDTIQEG